MHLPADISCRRLTYDAERVKDWRAILSAEEEERLQTFSAVKRQREFLTGRVAARTLVAERLDCTPAEVPLRAADDGAVEVDGHCLCVSITHSGTQAAAVVAERRIGVDLERIRPRNEGIERFLLHPEENGLLEELPLDRTRALILCWALKEAALKARRTGLRMLPKRLRLEVNPSARSGRIRDGQGKGWQARFEEWDGAYLAVAF